MYAVVKTGGKQYKVAKDDKIVVDRLEAEAGSNLVLDQVLMVANGDQVDVGAPTVKDAVVGATVLRHTRGDKIMVFRRKRRKNFRRIRGHRQDLTLLQITDIAPDGKLKAAKACGRKSQRQSQPKLKSLRQTSQRLKKPLLKKHRQRQPKPKSQPLKKRRPKKHQQAKAKMLK
jgi:large subunit ribosomal protein L21